MSSSRGQATPAGAALKQRQVIWITTPAARMADVLSRRQFTGMLGFRRWAAVSQTRRPPSHACVLPFSRCDSDEHRAAEMGQHVGTAAQIMADELGADWTDVSRVDSKWGYMVTVALGAKQWRAPYAGRGSLPAPRAAVWPQTAGHLRRHHSGGRHFASRSGCDAVKAPADRHYRLWTCPQSQRSMCRPGMVYGIPLVPPTRYGSIWASTRPRRTLFRRVTH